MFNDAGGALVPTQEPPGSSSSMGPMVAATGFGSSMQGKLEEMRSVTGEGERCRG